MPLSAPLAGITVLELGARAGAGAAGSLLAQLGASVVFAEYAPPRDAWATRFASRAQFAAGKLSVRIDPAADRELLERLAASADVVLLSPDVDPPELRAAVAGSGAIVCELTACGSSGPLAGQAYSEWEIQALSGMLEATGVPEQPPVPIALPVVEQLAGLYATAAVLCALRHKRLHGVAQSCEVALYDVAFSAMSSFLAPALNGDAALTRAGNRHTMAAPWNAYHAADGWVLLCSGSDEQWRRLAGLMGRPELAGDPAFARNADRVANVARVDACVQDWIGRHSVEACVAQLGELGLPCGPVVVIDGHPRDRNLEHRGMLLAARDPVSGATVRLPGSPFRMGEAKPARIPAPDEDRAEVLRIAQRGRVAAPVQEQAQAQAPDLPLHGLRVIEIGHYTTVPVTARSLGALGAEVAKVEPPGGEAVRGWPPAREGQGIFFTFQNTDKKSVCLDMGSAPDRALLWQMIAAADVLIENLRPGALAAKGFTPEALREANPRLVACAVSGFGVDSAYPGRAAFDAVIQAMSGLMDVTRIAGAPVKTGPSLADVTGAAFGLVAVLAALEQRDRGGEGAYLDLAMQEMAAWMTQTRWNRGAGALPQLRLLACRNGAVLLTDAGELPVRTDEAARSDRDALCAQLQAAGLRAVPVRSIREAVDAPQTRARRLWFDVAREGTPFPLLAIPFHLERTPPRVREPAPPLGRDTASITAAWRPSPP